MRSVASCMAAVAMVVALGAVPGRAQQESGVIGSGPPEDIFLEVTKGPDGEPVLSQEEFVLANGGYYRFNVVCLDKLTSESGFHFEFPGLLENSHLRILSIGGPDIEFYMQGLTFRAIECDDRGSARFSFHPMRKGVYPVVVTDKSVPPQEASARIVVE